MIGDVIHSRRHPDRSALQAILLQVFTEVDEDFDPLQEYRMTLGDEFQGLFTSIGEALLSSFRLRVSLLLMGVDVRFGVGWGEIPVHDAAQAPFAQDGPGWWHAREALERVQTTEQKREWPKKCRTALHSDCSERDSLANAFLICRDSLLENMDEVDLNLILGHLRGETTIDMAKTLGISRSAITQRQQGHGIYAVLRAHEQIEALLG